jgi:hypothetical protein
VIGYHVCYANLLYLSWALNKYRLCDNNHIADMFFARLYYFEKSLLTPFQKMGYTYKHYSLLHLCISAKGDLKFIFLLNV